MAARGGARPGAGRKPGKVAQATRDIQGLAKEHASEALSTLVTIAKSRTASDAARVAAANSILDRAYGKPKQSVDLNGEGLAGLSVTYIAPAAPAAQPVPASEEDYETPG